MKKYFKYLIAHPLFSGSFLMVGGAMAINVVNYLYHLIMGRVLGPVDYGVLASLYSILYITSVIPVSTSVAIVKFISQAKTPKERISVYKSINSFVLKLAAAISLSVIIFSPLIARFLKIDDFLEVAIVGPIIFLSLITLVNQSTLQGVLKFIGVVGPGFVSSLGKLIFGLIFVFLGYSVMGAMWGVLIGAATAYFYSRFLIKPIIDSTNPRKFKLGLFFKYSLPVFIQAVAFSSFFTVDVILVKHFFSPFEAGLYAALSTLGKTIFFATSPVTATMFPIIAGRSARGEKYSKILLVSIGTTGLLAFGILSVYYLFPETAIKLLYGSQYLAARESLVWMGLFMTFYSIAYLIVNFFLSIGRTKIAYLPLLFY